MSRVRSYRTVLNCLLGLASFVAAIAISGCTPIPSDAQQINGPEDSDPDGQSDANDNDQNPATDDTGDTVPALPPDTPTDDTDDNGETVNDNVDVGADDTPPPNDADDDLDVAETPFDPFEETPFLPPAEAPADPNPPTGGTGGNPDPPAQDPPAQDPPAQDPPAEDPPAEDPPAEDPPAEDPPSGEHPPEQPPADWPDNAYCAPSEFWFDTWAGFEEHVLVLVNQHRAAGANCGSAGSFAATTPLTMNPNLRCAARAHSTDMNVRDFFSHTNPDGQGPGWRITQSGYSFSWWGENIAWGYPTPESVVLGWMNSPGHCANIMNSNFTEIGVGYYQDNYWTQAFGRP